MSSKISSLGQSIHRDVWEAISQNTLQSHKYERTEYKHKFLPNGYLAKLQTALITSWQPELVPSPYGLIHWKWWFQLEGSSSSAPLSEQNSTCWQELFLAHNSTISLDNTRRPRFCVAMATLTDFERDAQFNCLVFFLTLHTVKTWTEQQPSCMQERNFLSTFNSPHNTMR